MASLIRGATTFDTFFSLRFHFRFGSVGWWRLEAEEALMGGGWRVTNMVSTLTHHSL